MQISGRLYSLAMRIVTGAIPARKIIPARNMLGLQRLIAVAAIAFGTLSNAAALELEITSSSDPVRANTAFTVTLTVSNSTASSLTNVVLQAVMPPYMSISPGFTAVPPAACLGGSTCNEG